MRRQTAALKRKQSGDKGFVFTVRAGLAQEHLYWGVAYSFFILALISSLLPRSVWVGNCQTAAAAAAAASVAALGPLSLSFTLFPPPPLHTLSFLASRSSHSLTPPPKTLLLNNLPPSFSPFLSCVLSPRSPWTCMCLRRAAQFHSVEWKSTPLQPSVTSGVHGGKVSLAIGIWTTK